MEETSIHLPLVLVIIYLSGLYSSKLTRSHFLKEYEPELALQLYKRDRFMRILVSLQCVIILGYMQMSNVLFYSAIIPQKYDFIITIVIAIMFGYLYYDYRQKKKIKKAYAEYRVKNQ